MAMPNTPRTKLALVGVSRDCFPIELTRKRMEILVEACTKRGIQVYACPTIIENEKDALAAVSASVAAGANAAVIYLGNFGPEGPLSIFAQQFPGPVMACAAAEESTASLIEGRGDAFCGLLSACYNFGLRDVQVHLPQNPVGIPEELALEIEHFHTVASVVLATTGVKIITFGPRPQDFFACNAPIRPLYQLGLEVMENSELDLLQLYEQIDDTEPEVTATLEDMGKELAGRHSYPEILTRAARLEVALKRFAEANIGSRQHVIFANKCWPAFPKAFGTVTCYVNSRLTAQGMPVSCEVDIYGTLSEYMCTVATGRPVTLLDINNSVPADMIAGQDLKGARPEDLFMGFHCGNTPSACLKNFDMKYQLIMHRLMEPEGDPDFTRGTMEGQLLPGPTTFFRFQSSAEGELMSYAAEGNILDIDPHSFGSIGVVAIPGFARFYRHVLLTKRFPHHCAVAFDRCGKVLFDALKLMGIDDVSAPLPGAMLYPGENPFV
jgi:L-fucose isomerase-like protein